MYVIIQTAFAGHGFFSFNLFGPNASIKLPFVFSFYIQFPSGSKSYFIKPLASEESKQFLHDYRVRRIE